MSAITSLIPEGVIPENIMSLITGAMFPVVLVAVIGLGFLAFRGFWFFEKALTVMGAIFFGAAGSTMLGPIVVASLGESAPANVNLSVIIGLICAALGAVLIRVLYKVALFVCGAFFGYTAGHAIAALLASLTKAEFFTTGNGDLITCIVVAVLVGILCVFLFKPVYIIVTSIPTMVAAGILLGTSIVTTGDQTVLIVSGVVGLIVGIAAASHQFKHS